MKMVLAFVKEQMKILELIISEKNTVRKAQLGNDFIANKFFLQSPEWRQRKKNKWDNK